MPSEVKIRIRRDTSANWTSSNPVLALGEIGADMDKMRLKVGNGAAAWKDRPWVNGDIYNGLETILQLLSGVTGGHLLDPVERVSDLPTTYPNPTVGDMAYVNEENAFYTWNGTAWVTLTAGGLGAADINALLDARLRSYSPLGMGYTVEEFNAFSKPTKIKFADGVTLTLAWRSGTQLNTVTSSTGEKMTMLYDDDGRITGRTVTAA